VRRGRDAPREVGRSAQGLRRAAPRRAGQRARPDRLLPHPASPLEIPGLAGAGRKGSLNSMEQKLLFALVYQKAYPLQELQGEAFEISQSRANHWIHRLLPVLQQTLDDIGVLPERKKRLNSSWMAGSDAVKGGKALKNRPCPTAARRKPIATRMS